MFNTQQLLFPITSRIATHSGPKPKASEEFLEQGYTVISHVETPEQARYLSEEHLRYLSLHSQRHFLKVVGERVQLAKADAIPVCGDSVDTSFQALHFDMGQPFAGEDAQLMMTAVALYKPMGSPESGAVTRVLPLKGLLQNLHAEKIEKRITEYVTKYGDGWDAVNTQRISCFARIVDAMSDTPSLIEYFDKTMAEWFRDENHTDAEHRVAKEHAFYKERGIDLSRFEKRVTLRAGNLLIIDNTRVAHGRAGKRAMQEIYQFMFGIEKASPAEISIFRKELATELAAD